MSELREAAQAVLNDYDRGVSIAVTERVIDHLRAALAQPETEAEPGMWMNRYGATMKTRNRATANAMGFTIPLYTHPPRNEWREAVHDELVTTWTLSAENKDDPRLALRDIINWHVRVALDPAVSSDAQALIERGKAMRDERCKGYS